MVGVALAEGGFASLDDFVAVIAELHVNAGPACVDRGPYLAAPLTLAIAKSLEHFLAHVRF